MHVRIALAAAAVAAAPLAGCSSGDDEPAASQSVAPVTDDATKTRPGKASVTKMATAARTRAVVPARTVGSERPDSVREDFLIPIAAGWEVDIQGDIGLTNVSGAQLLYPNDAYDDIVAFYDDWFESQPVEFGRSVVGERVFYQLLGDSIYQVNVLPDHEERGQTWVALQVSGGG